MGLSFTFTHSLEDKKNNSSDTTVHLILLIGRVDRSADNRGPFETRIHERRPSGHQLRDVSFHGCVKVVACNAGDIGRQDVHSAELDQTRVQTKGVARTRNNPSLYFSVSLTGCVFFKQCDKTIARSYRRPRQGVNGLQTK